MKEGKTSAGIKKRLSPFLRLAAAAALLFCGLFPCSQVRAAERTAEPAVDPGRIWGEYKMEEVSESLDRILPDYELDTERILHSILKGRLGEAAGMVWDGVKEKLFSQLTGLKNIFVSILLLGIASALFSSFSDVFRNHQIADISFYFLYLLLMSVLLRSFLAAADIASGTMENIVLFIKMFIPTYFMAVGAAAGAATAVVYYQLMLLLAYGVEKLVLSFLIPVIYSYMLLSVLNGIWAEERLTLLLELLKRGVTVSLKVAMGAVTGLSLFQSMISPVIDSLRTSAVKKAVSIIPGVGSLAEGVTEMVIGSAVLIKNSIGVLMLLLLLALCLIPLVKLLLIACMIKGGAALAGIVSDKRIAACANQVGDAALLLLRATFTAAALFLIVIAVVAYTSGGR